MAAGADAVYLGLKHFSARMQADNFGSAELSRMEIALAKAEVFQPETLPALKEKKAALTEERKQRLKALGIPESKLVPQYKCKKCSDTGFLPSGEVCDCYEKKDTPEEEFRAVGGSA